MNLVKEPWIPVVMQDGTPARVSLRDAFAKGEDIADLAANPCQRIALMRLLICVAQAALDGPKDEEDWLACKPRLVPAVLSYLDKWQHRFNLFGEHAFLQVDGLTNIKTTKKSDDESEKSSDKLDMTLAVGSSHTLFDAEARSQNVVRTSTCPANIALNLLVTQSFSLGGGQSSKTKWNGENIDGSENGKDNNNFTAGALSNQRAYTLIRGEDLLFTIHMNLITKNDVKSYMPSSEWGKPIWEEFPTSYHGDHVSKLRSNYLPNLVPLTRFCRISKQPPFNFIAYTNGYAYSDDLSCYHDPSVSVFYDKDDNPCAVSLVEGRHPWRDLAAILELDRAIGSKRAKGARCINHVRTLQSKGENGVVDIWIGGMVNRRAKIIDMVEWSAHFAIDGLGNLDLAFYRQCVGWAEKAELGLCREITNYSQKCGDPLFQKKENGTFVRPDKRSRELREKYLNEGRLIFWNYLDRYVETLVKLSEKHETSGLRVWENIIDSALHAAYDRTCPHETPRQIQAYAQGLKILQTWKKVRDRSGT